MTSTGGDISATWQGLSQLPQMLTSVRTGIQGLRAMVSTPSAATATGSPLAGAAIWALGAELLVFVAQTVQAIDDDIDGLTQTQQNYQANEDALAAQATSGVQAIDGLAALDRPALNAGLQSCTARAVVTGAAALETPARLAGEGVDAVGDTLQRWFPGAAPVVRGVQDAVIGVTDDVEALADGRERLADLQGACAPAGARAAR